MKIVGGSFGLSGRATFQSRDFLIISGAIKAKYSPSQVQAVSATEERQRKFGVLGFLIGAPLLAALLSAFLGLLGVVIGVVVALAGSFYSKKTNIVRVCFDDGKEALLKCSKFDANNLVAFKR